MFGVLQDVALQDVALLTPYSFSLSLHLPLFLPFFPLSLYLSSSSSLSPSTVLPLRLLTYPFFSFSIISHPLFPGEVGLRQ